MVEDPSAAIDSLLQQQQQAPKLHKLPQDTIRRIQSEQVVIDVVSAVKELIENSLDAGATKVEILMKNQGLESIIVKDNGSGIDQADHAAFGLRHHTSKISFELDSLQTYGFRGEGFSSICSVSTEVQVTTRTKTDPNAFLLRLDKTGKLVTKEDTAGEVGTTIEVTGLFKQFPVRFQNLTKNIQKESKKVHDLILNYCLIRPDVYFVFQDPPKPKLDRRRMKSVMDCIADLFGPNITDNLNLVEFDKQDNAFRISILLPHKEPDLGIAFRSSSDRSFYYVNHRPVDLPSIAKLVNAHMRNYFDVKKKYPFIVFHLQTDPSQFDVNYAPNKRKIQFHKDEMLMTTIKEVLKEHYPYDETVVTQKLQKEKTQQNAMDVDKPTQKDDLTQLYNNNNNNNEENDEMDFQDSNKITQTNDGTPQKPAKRRIEDTQEEHHSKPVVAHADLDTIRKGMVNKPWLPKRVPLPPQQSNTNNNNLMESLGITVIDVENFRIIGRLNKEDNNLPVLKIKNHLFLFNHAKADEVCKYIEMKGAFELNRDKLEIPVKVDETMLGSKENYETALDEKYTNIFQANGFEFRRTPTPTGTSLELCGMNNEVPNLGITDLTELIQNIKKQPQAAAIATTRPKKILKYFVEEATRHSMKFNSNAPVAELKRLIQGLTLPGSNQVLQRCPHRQPLFIKLTYDPSVAPAN